MLLYSLDKIRINDSWYCKEGDTYHAFFLQYPEDGDPAGMWTNQTCGHMSSKDLLSWEYHGTVLKPEKGLWNDKGIATGSVVKHNGLWHMLYTGTSENGQGGLAVAVSRDLMTWERVGAGPQIPTAVSYPIDFDGVTAGCIPLADPYIYPDAVDGKYYIFVNSHFEGRPENKHGMTAVFTTEDFVSFKPHKVAVLEDCERMETVGIWAHGGKYYMYGGIVHHTYDENGAFRQVNSNHLYVSERVDGPYIHVSEIKFPYEAEVDGKRPYIAKVITDPTGREVMLANVIPSGAVGPYGIKYLFNGEIELYKLSEYEK